MRCVRLAEQAQPARKYLKFGSKSKIDYDYDYDYDDDYELEPITAIRQVELWVYRFRIHPWSFIRGLLPVPQHPCPSV